MLRSAVLGIGVLALVCGLAAIFVGGFPAAFVFGLWGALIVIGIVFERFRYKPVETALPGPGWTRTGERFVDEDTGAVIAVWVEPKTGERKYVKD